MLQSQYHQSSVWLYSYVKASATELKLRGGVVCKVAFASRPSRQSISIPSKCNDAVWRHGVSIRTNLSMSPSRIAGRNYARCLWIDPSGSTLRSPSTKDYICQDQLLPLGYRTVLKLPNSLGKAPTMLTMQQLPKRSLLIGPKIKMPWGSLTKRSMHWWGSDLYGSGISKTYNTGVPIPMILREFPDSGTYVVIGPGYILGFMNGEEFEDKTIEILTFV